MRSGALTTLCDSDRGMISLEDACRRARRYAKPLRGTETLPLAEALDRILDENVTARIDLPPFDQSAMDGYALVSELADRNGTRIDLAPRIAAGDRARPLPRGLAARILTGAAIPHGADCVVMQEHVQREGNRIIVDGPVRSGSNIRRRGEDMHAGEQLFSSGERLDARHLALLAAQGISQVRVRDRPRIAVISTGNELRQPGEPLDERCIYDSNRPMVLALAEKVGAKVIDGGWVPDHPEVIARRILSLAKSSDLVVTSGGASAGDEDHSSSAMAAIGDRFEILKIALKPGKPAIVGNIGKAVYLGLPGNPVAALVSWLTVGGAILACMIGREFSLRLGCPLPTLTHYRRTAGRREFVPARIVCGSGETRVEILGRGGSARLKPLVLADGLAEIAAVTGNLEPGDLVSFHSFRNGFTV
jgi:molybdopterin molybdotransferase